jgi:hypothetical protein
VCLLSTTLPPLSFLSLSLSPSNRLSAICAHVMYLSVGAGPFLEIIRGVRAWGTRSEGGEGEERVRGNEDMEERKGERMRRGDREEKVK